MRKRSRERAVEEGVKEEEEAGGRNEKKWRMKN